ncbi:hypothetical protein AB1Y20_003172 [Prymnesium parvum]|uniref:Uncharacterized protein n=1 Tax=Prymnesium parvum TaxID=97485 RepID=A0AB34JCA0_PRYPA
MARAPARLVAIVWGCAVHLWREIAHAVLSEVDGSVSPPCVVRVPSIEQFVRDVYAVDDVSNRSLALKLSRQRRCSADAVAMNITFLDPQWRSKGNGKPISRAMENLKKVIRSRFRSNVTDYIHDVIFHGADNEAVHTSHLDAVISSRGRCYTPSWYGSSMAGPVWKEGLPNLLLYLQSICEIPHIVIKLDGQPHGFPDVVRLGGDVDILTDAISFSKVQRASEHFVESLASEGEHDFEVRVLRKPHNWRIRLERGSKLTFQIDIAEAVDAERLIMLARRYRVFNASFCLWRALQDDESRLRKLDCISKAAEGRSSALCSAFIANSGVRNYRRLQDALGRSQ